MPVGIALVFEMTAPVFIALYVWLVRREKVRGRLWVALLLSLSGLVFVAEVWEDGGSLDPVNLMDPTGIERMQNLLPDFRGGTMIEGAGHWTQQEAPQAFNEALLGFLRTL